MKVYDVCGIGNGLLDILVEISEEEFQKTGVEKASMRLVDTESQEKVLSTFKHGKAVLASGGSVANSVIGLSQLGGKGAFICCLGDDRYGMHYSEEFEALGITLANPLLLNEKTGTSLVLITPDAERSMRTCLGVSSALSAKYVSEEIIKQSKWLFIEGYLFSNPENGQAAVRQAIEYARKHHTRIAVTFSESWVIEAFGAPLREAVQQADLVFANEAEACAFTGTSDYKAAFESLKKQIKNVVVTAGPKGALLRYNGAEAEVAAVPCEPKDLTGAGDMFAAAVLYGVTQDIEPAKAGKAACYLAMKVITQVGARLRSGVRDHWDSAVGLP